MKINLLGLGVQKAGTSTLHDILITHPDIYLPEFKEAHFFDLTEKYLKGLKWLTDTFFTNYRGEKILGEFTPDYIYMEKTAERILETLGSDVKFIIIFRHPVDRAVSHYNMDYRKGFEKSDFFEAIINEQNNAQHSEWNKIHFSYIDRGFYARQLNRYLALFPKENFLYLIFEKDIIKNMSQTVDRIQAFLKIEHKDLNINIKSNEGFDPYSVKLNRIIRSNAIKKIGGKLFSPSFRITIKNAIFRFNKKTGSNQLFKLTNEDRERII